MKENHYQGRSDRQQKSNEMIAAVCVLGLVIFAFILFIYKLSQLSS